MGKRPKERVPKSKKERVFIRQNKAKIKFIEIIMIYSHQAIRFLLKRKKLGIIKNKNIEIINMNMKISVMSPVNPPGKINMKPSIIVKPPKSIIHQAATFVFIGRVGF